MKIFYNFRLNTINFLIGVKNTIKFCTSIKGKLFFQFWNRKMCFLRGYIVKYVYLSVREKWQCQAQVHFSRENSVFFLSKYNFIHFSMKKNVMIRMKSAHFQSLTHKHINENKFVSHEWCLEANIAEIMSNVKKQQQQQNNT